jgi:hypothetical protein
MPKRPEPETDVLTLDASVAAAVAPEPTPTPPAGAAKPKLVVPLGRGARGKTKFVQWAAERAQAAGREVVIADADRTNATLSSYFQGVLTPPSVVEGDVRDWLAAIIEQQIEQRFSAFLDLGGGDLILKQVAREMQLAAFLEGYGIQPVAVHLIGADRDDLAYLRDVEEGGVFAPEATILVLNEALVQKHRSPQRAFEAAVLNHPIFGKALERGACAVWMPLLDAMPEIDERRLTFAAAEAGKVKPSQAPIGPWRRQQIALWRKTMEANFGPVAHWLP